MANFDRFERLKSRLNNERRKLNESGFRYEPDGEMSLTSNFNDIMPFVSVYERVVMKEFPEAGSIECALGGNDLFDAMSDGELNDETAVDWIVDKVRDNCEDEDCDEVEVNESKLNEGTANFQGNGGVDWLPLLVYLNSDDVYADLHREANDLYSEIDDDDERREKIDAYIDTYFEERLGDGIRALTDDDVENLENELFLFNEKMRARGEELAYGEGSDDDAQYQRGQVLKDLKVGLKPGYYEGVQLFCDIDGDESFLTEDDKNELIEFFKKIKKDFSLTELAVAYKASNGETGYSIVDDEVKGDDEAKEESLKEEITHEHRKERNGEYDFFDLGFIDKVKYNATHYLNWLGKKDFYQVSSHRPYDDADYHYAYSKDGRNWEIILNKDIKDNITTDFEDFVTVAKKLGELDASSKIEPRILRDCLRTEESLKEGAKAVSIEKKDGEVEDTLVFDSYDEAHEYLELLASAKKYPYHEIVEDSYETDNGLLLIGYANYNEDDKLPEDEIEHILVKYSTKEQNDANEKKEDELDESKEHSDDEINDAYFGAMRFFSKGGKDPEEFLAKHPNADADAVRSAFDNFKAGNKWKELKKEKEDSFEEDKTSVKAYNDRAQKIFDDAEKLHLAQKDFLIKHGVSEEEADKLYQDTGLHGSPLQQKLIDLGINDEFFAKYDFKTGELKEGNAAKEDSEKGLCGIEESFEDEIKKFEVCYFVKEDEHDEIGQWETIGQYDTYEEAKEVFDDARHNGLVPGSSDGATIIDQICIYEREDDGSQKRIECDESMHESFEDEVKGILKPRIVDGGMIKPFGNDEKLPRGFRFLAGTSGRNQRGYVKYKGNRYWYEVDGDDVKVVRESVDNPYVAKPKEDGKVHINKNAGNPKRNAELFNQSMGFAESLNEEEERTSFAIANDDRSFVDEDTIKNKLIELGVDWYVFKDEFFVRNATDKEREEIKNLGAYIIESISGNKQESLNEEDADDLKLPKEVEVSIGELPFDGDFVDLEDSEISDLLSDYLSDKYGFCHKGFKWKGKEDSGDTLVCYDIEWDVGESLNEEDEGKKDDKSDISNEFGSNVKDEWDAIEGYNTLESEIKSSSLSEEEKAKLLSIIDDIRSEEYRHVGQLQQALKTVTDDANKIDDGEKEAESQEDSHEHEEEHVDEVTDDIIDTEISEVEKDAE